MTDSEGEPWFVGSDVANVLGYSNSREASRKHVEKDDVTKRDTIDALGRVQLTTFINESGLYALIHSSKLESARRFRHWVTSEVLPSIVMRRPMRLSPAHRAGAVGLLFDGDLDGVVGQ